NSNSRKGLIKMAPALKDATAEQRAQFLKAMDVFGPEAHQAGLDLLKDVDQGKAVQLPKAADAQHVATVEALSIPPIGGKILKCLLKCAPHLPDFKAYALCVFTCMVGG